MNRFLLPAVLLLSAGSLAAQTAERKSSGAGKSLPESPPVAKLDALTLEPEIRTKIDGFFGTLKTGKVPDAYSRLFEGSILPAENPEMVTKLVDSTTRVLQLTGTLNGAEILRVRSAGRTLREVTYVLNGEKRPLRWRFYLYLSDGHWQIIDTNVATEASAFFEEEK